MTLTTQLIEEKGSLESFLVSSYSGKLPENLLNRLDTVNSLISKNFNHSPLNLALANVGNEKQSAGSVFSLKVSNKNSATRYFLLIDVSHTPDETDSASIVDVIPIAGNGVAVLDSNYYGEKGLVFENGISWAFSSTDTSITLASSADIISRIGYV